MPISPTLAAVHTAIADAGGWLPFDDYLNLILHNPQYGYYGSGRVRFGADGDFITAPHLSPLFGRALAKQAADIIAHTGGGILELGAGDGQLAADILTALGTDFCPYDILETSAPLRARQQQKLTAYPSVRWLSTLPTSIDGVIIANEVLDATPFRLFAKRQGQWHERGISSSHNALHWSERPAAPDPMRQRLESLSLPDDYETEVNPRAEALTQTVTAHLRQGAALIADYGFGRREYYHPQRLRGTMMCHHRHRADDNPLLHPGEKDITAHLDFTAIADAGLAGGANLVGYVSQAAFLINLGIADWAPTASDRKSTAHLAGLHKLLAPHEMGELFKFIAFAKGDVPPLRGFADNDRRHSL